MSIDIAGLACTVLSSTRRRPHYNRSPGCQPSELPLMVGAQQHHQPLVNRIKSHSTKGWSRWCWDRVQNCHSSLPPWPLPLPSKNRLGGQLLKWSCELIPSTWNTSSLAGTFSYLTKRPQLPSQHLRKADQACNKSSPFGGVGKQCKRLRVPWTTGWSLMICLSWLLKHPQPQNSTRDCWDHQPQPRLPQTRIWLCLAHQRKMSPTTTW